MFLQHSALNNGYNIFEWLIPNTTIPFRPVFHLYGNVKREREARTWKIKQTIFYCMYSLSAWARREREARIYDMWPWSASVKPIATCSDFSRSRKVFTDEQPPWKVLCLCQMQLKNLLKQKCPNLYDHSLKEYRDTDIKDRVLQTIAETLNIPGLKGTPYTCKTWFQ